MEVLEFFEKATEEMKDANRNTKINTRQRWTLEKKSSER